MRSLIACLGDYLELRRRLGFKLRREHSLLRHFVGFCKQQDISFVTTKVALKWATQPAQCQPCQWATRLGMVRRFAQYLSAADPRTEIPPQGLLRHSYRRKTPYLYRDQEVDALLRVSRRLPSPRHLLGPTVSTLLGLLAVSGLRVGEALALDRSDVDLNRALLTIRKAKGNKSRLVPIHASTKEALRQYERLRDRLCPQPQSPSFFLSERGTRFSEWTARRWFIKVSKQIGLRSPADRRGPRLHQLRHRFAIQTVLHWYRTDQDVETHLPELTTYLGHVNVTKTYWYLSATPELLCLARERCERKNGGPLL
jgi:integrase